jgi:hypothetical protein
VEWSGQGREKKIGNETDGVEKGCLVVGVRKEKGEFSAAMFVPLERLIYSRGGPDELESGWQKVSRGVMP